jgi:hypothetical protein
MKKHLLLMTIMGLISLPATCQSARNDGTFAGVTISYAFQAQRLTVHEPLILNFRVANGTSKPLGLDLGSDRKGGFSFTVTRPDGTKLKLPPLNRAGVTRIGRVAVQPGETYSQNLLLNEWYDFSMPGKYELEGYLENPVLTDSGAQKDSGFRETVEVGPRDELSLSKTCDALATQVETLSSSEEAHEAAFALSHVNDPVAVAYLRRALLADITVAPTLINGLEAIGNEAAVQALGDGLKAAPAWADLFRSSLARIRQQSSDPRVQQDVDRILNKH